MVLIIKSKPISSSNGVGRRPTTGVGAHAAASDHVHSVLGQSQILFKKVGANFNVTTDQILDKHGIFTSYIVERIRVFNASISLTTAQGAVWSAAAKGGVGFMATTQAYAALTGPTLGLDATLVAAALDAITGANDAAVQAYLSLTTAQGAPATADVYVIGIPLTE